MDPSLPVNALVIASIPVPDSIPVHFGWLNFFFILTFVLHLLFMNAMLGCGIIALVRSLRGGQQDLFIAKEISLKLPYTIAFTVNMGVAPLLFIQVLYGSFIYTSSVLMAWYWLSIIGIIIIAYYSAYIFDFKFDTLGATRSIFIGVCVLLMLLVALVACYLPARRSCMGEKTIDRTSPQLCRMAKKNHDETDTQMHGTCLGSTRCRDRSCRSNIPQGLHGIEEAHLAIDDQVRDEDPEGHDENQRQAQEQHP